MCFYSNRDSKNNRTRIQEIANSRHNKFPNQEDFVYIDKFSSHE